LSLIGASFAKKKYQIILSQGFCFGWGMGFLLLVESVSFLNGFSRSAAWRMLLLRLAQE